MTAKLITETELTEIFTRALAAAAQHANDHDGGTCNFDHPWLYLPRREKLVLTAAEKAGMPIRKSEFLGRRVWALCPHLSGQANRRSRMAEACAKVLREAGLDAGMYYAMD